MGSNIDNIFLNACKNGQKGVVEAFVKKGGIHYDKRDANGNTPLFYASQKGARDIVKVLIENGADVSLANNQSMTPLHAASKTGNKEIITILTKAGADINTTDKEGKTPLIYAVSAGKSEVTRQLLTLGADKTVKDNNNHNALDYATSGGLRDIIALLTDETEMNQKDNYGNTPLHQAVAAGQSEVVIALLNQSKDNINELNDNGESPLILASMNANIHLVELLLEKGADANLKLLDGSSPASLCGRHGEPFYRKSPPQSRRPCQF